MEEVKKYQVSTAVFVVLMVVFIITTLVFAAKWDTKRLSLERVEEKCNNLERANYEQGLVINALLGLVEWSAAGYEPLTTKMAAEAIKEAVKEANLPSGVEARAEAIWKRKFNYPLP